MRQTRASMRAENAIEPHWTTVLLIWLCSFRIGREQGIRGVYKGHQATLLRIFPYAALNYACFEQYKRVSAAMRTALQLAS